MLVLDGLEVREGYLGFQQKGLEKGVKSALFAGWHDVARPPSLQ